MRTLAPPVVAVVVAHDPGPWFEEALASLGTQDYAELSVLVLDAGSGEDLTARVAAVLPSAYVRRFEDNRGYGSSVNEVQSMVDGADYFLLCHDDVALFPDAVHLMVEEAFRSNAGIVSPKVVSWDDPERLVHVGMTVDKGGSVVDRVQPHEVDHGQHDAVRDVFVAPGGSTLVRADLFDELGGYDPAIVAMGEDLDLCWRAQVAGARVIVAPDARVRHLEELAGGSRPIDPALVEPDAERPRAHPVTLQELQRRHELLAVLKCYGPLHLLRVVPQVLVLAVGEIIVAEVAGNRSRARAVRRAWRWNLGRLATLRQQRKELRTHRRLSDREIRALQIGGSARLATYGRRVFQHGFQGAHADELVASGRAAPGSLAPPGADGLAVVDLSAGGAGDPAPSAPGGLGAGTRLVAWLTATLVVLIGSRGIVSGRLPVVGQFVPFPGWSTTLSQFAVGWQPAGVGTTAPASPALALTGLAGTLLFGAMGATQKVLIFACVPLGVWGVVRLVRPFGSQRAALVGGPRLLGHGPRLRRPRPRAVGRPGRLRRHPLGVGPALPGDPDRPVPLPGTDRPARRGRRRRGPPTGRTGRRPSGGGWRRGAAGTGRCAPWWPSVSSRPSSCPSSRRRPSSWCSPRSGSWCPRPSSSTGGRRSAPWSWRWSRPW